MATSKLLMTLMRTVSMGQKRPEQGEPGKDREGGRGNRGAEGFEAGAWWWRGRRWNWWQF